MPSNQTLSTGARQGVRRLRDHQGNYRGLIGRIRFLDSETKLGLTCKLQSKCLLGTPYGF